jgi:hypothetical protein
MTVPSSTRRAGPFSGTGALASFPFTFKVFAKTDVSAQRAVSGVTTTLVQDTDYTVALNTDQDATPGGTVLCTLPVGATLTLLGAMPYDQPTDLPSGGAYRAKVVEDAFDRLTIQTQQLAESADRSLRAPVGEILASLPNKAARSNTLLAFNGNGDPTVGVPVSGTAADVLIQLADTTNLAKNARLVGWVASGPNAVPTNVGEKLSRPGADLEDYGGAADGITDNSVAFNRAIAAGAKRINAPASGNYRFASGIVIPQGVTVTGGNFVPSNGPQGTVFLFDLAVADCVTITGSNRTGNITGLCIGRAVGSIPAGSRGLVVQGSYPVVLERLGLFRHAVPLFLGGTPPNPLANLGVFMRYIFTGAASDSHLVIDSMAETRIDMCRFGVNGGGDLDCNSYIRIQGGDTANPAGGPNTLHVVNTQFNQGQNKANYWVDFANKTAGSISDLVEWAFTNCHIEAVNFGIRSDATWGSINRLMLTSVEFNDPVPFLFLSGATSIDNWVITNLLCYGSMTVAPSPQINFAQFSNSYFLGSVSITSASAGSTVSFSNCIVVGGLTAAGPFANFGFDGGGIGGAGFTNAITTANVGPVMNFGLVHRSYVDHFRSSGAAAQAQNTTVFYGENGFSVTESDVYRNMMSPGFITDVYVAVTNTPLPGQTFQFQLFLNSTPVGAVMTISNGQFEASLPNLGISVPFLYKDTLSLRSVFSPTSGSSRVRSVITVHGQSSR